MSWALDRYKVRDWRDSRWDMALHWVRGQEIVMGHTGPEGDPEGGPCRGRVVWLLKSGVLGQSSEQVAGAAAG